MKAALPAAFGLVKALTAFCISFVDRRDGLDQLRDAERERIRAAEWSLWLWPNVRRAEAREFALVYLRFRFFRHAIEAADYGRKAGELLAIAISRQPIPPPVERFDAGEHNAR